MAAGDKAFWADLQLARPRFNGTFTGASLTSGTTTSLTPTVNVQTGGVTVSGSTITVPTAGEYEIGISLRYASQATAAGVRIARFNVNGADAGFLVVPTTTGLNATNITAAFVSRLVLNAGDQVVFQGLHTAGAALALGSPSHAWIDRVPQ